MAKPFTVTQAKNCGVFELSDIAALPTPEAVIAQTILRMAENEITDFESDDVSQQRAFFYFVGADRSGVEMRWAHTYREDDYAGNLAQYITEHHLGIITVSAPSANWTGNVLRMFVWAPNWPALRVRYQELMREARS